MRHLALWQVVGASLGQIPPHALDMLVPASISSLMSKSQSSVVRKHLLRSGGRVSHANNTRCTVQVL